MSEILAALFSATLTLMQVPPSAHFAQPEVKLVPYEEIAKKACDNTQKCRDVHAYTDPYDNVIYIDEKIDPSFTLSKAEVIYEMGRSLLYQGGKYSVTNSCSTNTRIEQYLLQMRLDFILSEVQSGTYKGYGLPEVNDLPTHYFYCVPDDKYVKPKDLRI